MQPRPDHDLGRLYRRFWPALMSFFLRRIRNHAEAEDLTQEVFIRLARSGAAIETAQAYIFQTAANLLRDRARAEKVRLDYRLGLGAVEQADVELLDPDRVVLGREQLARLASGLHELPERTRSVFVLYRLEGMSRADIATS